MISAFSRISKSLDSRDIGELYLALESLPDDFQAENAQDAVEIALFELITWDLDRNSEIEELVLRRLLGLLKEQKLEEMTVSILKYQAPVATEIAVEIMEKNHWKLSPEDCEEIWRKIELTRKNGKNPELSRRITANCAILRASGAPERWLRSLLQDGLELVESENVSEKFLKELAISMPFHPILDIQDQKPSFFFPIPRVTSRFHRFHVEIDRFTEFISSSAYHPNHQTRPILSVFFRILERINELEQPLGAPEIERIVLFWLAGIRIFEGPGIGIGDIQEAAKWIEKCAAKFEISRRPLFLKHFLRKISENKDSSTGMEPQIVATIITTFQRNAFGLNSPEFYEELGEFWTLCLKLKYDDVYYSTVFYSSVFALAQAQAVFRVKKGLLRAVYETILRPMHSQIMDFVELKNVEKKKNEEEMGMENLGAEYFQILICTWKNAEERILGFINE